MNSGSRIFCFRCARERYSDRGVCPSCGYDASVAPPTDEPPHTSRDVLDHDPDNSERLERPDAGRRRFRIGNLWGSPAGSASLTSCPRCRSDNPPGSEFCGNCGTPLLVECPSCDAPNPVANRYCNHCGVRRGGVQPRAIPRPSSALASSIGHWLPSGSAGPLRIIAAGSWLGHEPAKPVFHRAREALDCFDGQYDLPGSARARLAAEAIFVGILTLVGFLIRVWDVGSTPAGPAGDESAVALEVIRILNGEWIGIWSGAALGNPTGQMFWVAPFFWLGGPTLEMLRLSSVILGTALIPICYVLVRLLFPFRVAFLAAALLTFFTWFVVVSRIGFPVNLSVFMAFASICLLVYAARSQRFWAAVLGGLILGLGLFSFKGYVIYFCAIWAAAVLVVLINSRLRRRWTIYLALAASLVAGAAMLEFYATSNFLSENLQSQYGVERSDLFSFPSYFSRLAQLVVAVHDPFPPSGYGFDGIIPKAILPALYAVFFWFGLLVTLLFVDRRPFQLVLLGWLVGMAPALLVPGGETRRYLLGVFFVLLLVAIGFSTAWHLFSTRWLFRRIVRPDTRASLGIRWAAFAVTLFVCLLFIAPFAALNLRHFSQWPESSEARFQFAPDLAEAAEFLNGTDTAYQVRFYSARWPLDYETLRWLAPNRSGINGAVEFGGDGTIFSDGLVSQPTVFILLGGYFHLIDDLKSAYPSGTEHVGPDSDGRPRFIAYTIQEPPAPGTVIVPPYHRLVPNPEETAFSVGVPVTFVLRTNQKDPAVLTLASSSGVATNFALEAQECPAVEVTAVELTDGESINVRPCGPGTSSINLFRTGESHPIQQYWITATVPTTSEDAPEFVILPDPSHLGIRAVPTKHHPLHLHTTRSSMIVPHPPGSVVLHNNPDLQGQNGCELVQTGPEGDTRLLIILPESDRPSANPFFLVACSPGEGALEVVSDDVTKNTYTFTISAP